MHTSNTLRDLNGMLNSIRIQIQAFEASLKVSPRDRELRRRIEHARIYELVILAKLSEQPVN
jgi:hypothetical protein